VTLGGVPLMPGWSACGSGVKGGHRRRTAEGGACDLYAVGCVKAIVKGPRLRAVKLRNVDSRVCPSENLIETDSALLMALP